MANMMILVVLCLFFTVSVLGYGGGIPGGWSYVDPRDENVQNAARFAVSTKYQATKPQFLVILARKQVVAGMNYDLTVEVSSENPCRVDHYQVWDRFGTLTLTKSDTLLDRCTGGDHLLRGSTSETK